jgi:hypothetical protein
VTVYRWIGPGNVVEARLASRRSNGKSIHVIRDEMDSTWHPGNGRRYTSKAKFRQATRDAGCVEVGNDPAIYARPRAPVEFNPTVRRQQIRESIRRQLHGGRA